MRITVLTMISVFNFTTRGDICGWMPDNEGFLHYGLFIEGGRVIDQEERKLKTCLREIAQVWEVIQPQKTDMFFRSTNSTLD